MSIRVGLFDSGVGGLTVLKRVAKLYPNFSFIYLADTARIPYGSRNLNELRKIAKEIVSWFDLQNIDVLLVACNTTNSIALDVINNNLNIPVYGLIESVSLMVEDKRVGVLATPSTVKSNAYTKAILEFNPKAFVLEQPCPEFVSNIELDDINLDKLRTLAIEYLTPLLKAEVESIILGCSHYPLIIPLLSELIPSKITLIDPAIALSFNLESFLGAKIIDPTKRESLTNSKFYVTSDPNKFAIRSKNWLNICPEVELVSLRNNACVS